MIFSYYYLDLLLVLRDFFLISLILISICIYTFLEKKFSKSSSKIGLFYSVSLYFIFLLNIYFISCISQVQSYYYLFDYTFSNLHGVFFFKLFLVFFFF